jgi:hypothetical protein
MKGRVLRSLVIAISLLLVVPPGWCCMVPVHAATATDAKATATVPMKPAGCRGCCKHETQPQPGPADTPSGPPPGHCCCIDRLTGLPSPAGAEKAGLGFAFAAPLPHAVSVPPLVRFIEEAASVVHPPTRQLHILKCVWLC